MKHRVCAVLAIAFFLFTLPNFAAHSANKWNLDVQNLARFGTNEIATIQRLLRRLGHLGDDDLTRKPDGRTVSALVAHLEKVHFSGTASSAAVIRSLFRTAWLQEGWGAQQVEGQDVVVDPEEVREAQQALQQLGYAPGPVDGVFGPATFSGVEVFQEDNELNVTGLLTRNTFQSILRRAELRDRSPERVVHVLNWPDYIDPDVLIQFEKETNIKVVHEVFESSDETAALLMVGSTRFDVMVQTDTKMKQLVDDGQALKQLDRAQLPNAKHLDNLALTYTSVLDPGNKHSLPYMWGTVGIAVNNTKVKQVRPNVDRASMSLFLDPEIAADLSKCGLAVVDEPGDVIPLMIAHFGGDLLDIKPADIEKVQVAVAKVAPYVEVVSADRIIDDIAEGKYCVAIGYSGDVFLARDTAAESGVGEITYHVPETGSVLWFDRFIIPKNARNVDTAYQFINFLMKPKIAAANTNYLQYASPNLAATQYVDDEIRNDPGVYPPANVMKKLVVLSSENTETQTSAYARIWSQLRGE